jgi:hypothetical protein
MLSVFADIVLPNNFPRNLVAEAILNFFVYSCECAV